MIYKLVRRNIGATKGRLLLMLLSIVLGVSFVSGSFLLADSLRSIFTEISATIYQGVDAEIRAADSDFASGEQPTRFDETLFAEISALDEVEYAEPLLRSFELIFTTDEEGEVHRPLGPPVFASAWSGPSPVSAFILVDGRAPGPGEIAIDTSQANAHDLEIGQTVPVVGPGVPDPIPMEIVATVSFGTLSGSGGAYFNLVDLATMQQLLGAPGEVDGISLNAKNDVSGDDLISIASANIADPSLEIVPGSVLIDEQNAEFSEFIDIFGYILLGFAIVVLFVSTFIIYNTFAILIGQRIRQFGLLRSIGATGGQLTRMVLIEALIIGVIASIVGLFGGIGVATVLKWLFSQGGGEFPDGPLIFKARTIIIVAVLGIGVTVGSALLPAWLAQRISPLAALRDGAAAAATSSRTRRVVRGAVCLGIGVLLLLVGLFSSIDTAPRLVALGIGAALSFIGVALLSVLFASLVTRIIGYPIESAFGLTGRLGRDNASRNPQRTAATATALMIGLALITGVLVLAQSFRASFQKTIDETVAADVLVYEGSAGLEFGDTTPAQVAERPEIDQVAAISTLRADIADDIVPVSGFDIETGTSVYNPKVIEGRFSTGPGEVMVFADHAEDAGYEVGQEITATFQVDNFTETFEIVGIFDDNTFFDTNNWIFDRSFTSQYDGKDTIRRMGATFVDGVSAEDGAAAVEDALRNQSQLTVENNAEFKATQDGQLNSVLFVIFGLLALCIIVAFIGIVNTMALSILERTREIGLLRAVGTSRRQLRAMVRYEAIIVGFFGAGLGIILGLVIGYAAVTAIPASFLSEVVIPWEFAIVFMVVGGVLGMLAAVFPARRAAKMNVLDAISTL